VATVPSRRRPRPTRVSVWHLRVQNREAIERRSIYVWQLPVRIAHWSIAGSIVVLALTGYYIHNPFLSPATTTPGATGVPHDPGFFMGTVRAVHVAAGFVFVAALLGRFYWAFVGNRWAHWRAYWPFEAWQRRDLKETLRYYAFRRAAPPPATGHNPLAGLAYGALYTGFALAALSGMSLYAWQYGRGPFVWLFGWTYDLVSISQIRLVHFFLMFWFVAFVVHHVYSALLVDIEEQNGEISSMLTGWKVEHWTPSGDAGDASDASDAGDDGASEADGTPPPAAEHA
jgi:Ni/Fe-hydrogenase 1 B-type cytochrome subunit